MHDMDATLIPLSSDCAFCTALTSLVVQICDDLEREVLSDHDALHLMNLVLKALKRDDKITAVYASASAARPQDASLLKLLFAAYVRYAK